MTSERWALVEKLFHAASSLDVADRAVFLAEQTDGDPGLRGEVELLLAADGAEHNLVDAAIAGRDLATAAVTGEALHMQVGPYRLIELIGKGGMGSVYLAERADKQFQQRVAVKLVRADRESPEIADRFRSERQILASLVHPNIARLLDGGMASFGAPYLVMEYVEGVSLIEYCERRQIPLSGRLQLFRSICSAVECAHRSLIVHRDIKPGNILVTAEGVPKLLDFGIARILTTEGAGTHLTRTGERLLTPEYAAPEQIRNEPITTATDVYALGVLLYEMLTGTTPFRGASQFELEQKICTAEPGRPSAIRQTFTDGGKLLRGDLDSIILKALRKTPAERYGSVESLSADIDRYLDGLPVAARKGSARYRAGKFARRNWRGVAAGSAFALSLIAFFVGLKLEGDSAKLAGSRATAVSGFLSDLFRGADPDVAKGRVLTARDLLDQGARKMESDRKLDPAVRASLLDTMADAYRNIGAIDRSIQLLEDELRVQRQAPPGPVRNGMERTLRQLGDQCRMASDFDAAEKYLRQALALDDPSADHGLERSNILNNLGLVLGNRGRLAEAEQLIREGVAISRRLPSEWQDTLTMTANLASVLEAEGRFEESIALQREVLGERRRRLGDDHPQVARSMQHLGGALEDAGEYGEALSILQAALATERKVLGEKHNDTLATGWLVGRVLNEQGRSADSEAMFRRTMTGLDGRSETFEAMHLETGLAALRFELGEYEESEALYRQALATAVNKLGPGNLSEAAVQCGLGAALVRTGALAEAEERLTRCLNIRRERLAAYHPQIAGALTDLAALRQAQKRFVEAEDLYKQAIEIDRRSFPNGHPQTAGPLIGLSRLLMTLGRNSEANTAAAEALELRRRFLPATSWRIAEAENAWGRALFALGRTPEALPILNRTRASLLRDPGSRSEAARLAQ